MIQSDFSQFSSILVGMYETLTGKAPSQAVIDIYWATLRDDWPMEDFRGAAITLLKTSEFMPRPAAWTELRKQSLQSPFEVWTQLVDFVRRGDYRHGDFHDAAVHEAAIAIGGYRAISTCEEAKLHFLEKRFTEAYETRSARAAGLALPAPAPERLALPAANGKGYKP